MRRTKTVEANRARHRKNPNLRILVVWAVFLLSAAAVFLWARAENQRIITEYEQSVNCQLPGEENCREVLKAIVDQTSIFDAGFRPVRGTAGGDFDIGVQIVFTMPDACTEIIRVSENSSTWYKGDEKQRDFWFSFREPFGIQTGDLVSVTLWNSKIVTVQTRDDVVIHSADHPENYAKVHYPVLWSIFTILLVVLIIWTGYEILRIQR